MVAKKQQHHFAAPIEPVQAHPAALFCTVRGVLYLHAPPDVDGISSVPRCNALAGHFTGKINHIPKEVDSGLVVQNQEVQGCLSGPIL